VGTIASRFGKPWRLAPDFRRLGGFGHTCVKTSPLWPV